MNDTKKIKIAILGGDKRQISVAQELLSSGYRVSMFGFANFVNSVSGGEYCTDAVKAVKDADFILLPLPSTKDKLHLNSHGEKILLCDIVKLAAENSAILMGGILPENIVEYCEALGVEAYDYFQSERLQMKNALPSAEGALMIAMEHTDITVKGMKVLICGHGRIGALLADMLKKLGASVSVGARRDESLCEISMLGYRAVRIEGDGKELREAIKNSDVIFNTVPSVIFTEKVLKGIKNKPLYIEIASSPGGIDLSAAQDSGIETVFAPSLPGKYAPVSAGKYIFETISDIISERRTL